MITPCEVFHCSNATTHVTIKNDETRLVCEAHADGEHVRKIDWAVLPFLTANEFLHRPLDKA